MAESNPTRSDFLGFIAGYHVEEATPAAIRRACELFGKVAYRPGMTIRNTDPANAVLTVFFENSDAPAFEISGFIWRDLLDEEARRAAARTGIGQTIVAEEKTAAVLEEVRSNPSDLPTEELIEDAQTALNERDRDRAYRRIAEVWERGRTASS